MKAILQGQESKKVRWMSNPNLLINWYFANPVNRNGQTEYTERAYTIDRWKMDLDIGTITLEDDGLLFDGAANAITFFQPNEDELLKSLEGRTVTASILYTVLSDTCASAISLNENDNIKYITNLSGKNGETNVTSVTFTVVPKTTNIYLEWLYIARDDKIKVHAVKVELGDHQTLAHKEGDTWVLNEIPNFAEEYVKCLQYSPITGEFVGSQHSNPNLLDNWYFVGGGSQLGGGQFPINQRGQTEYQGPGYTIDRFYSEASAGKVSVQPEGVTFSTEGGACVFFQRKESFSAYMLGKQFTLSLLTPDGVLYTKTNTLELENKSIDFISEDWGTASVATYSKAQTLRLFLPDGKSLSLVAAKLELGDHQTLAHKEGDTWVLNEVPDYGEELAKCQRYQLALPRNVRQRYAAILNQGSGEAFIPTPVTMRGNPTISKIGETPTDWGAAYMSSGATRITDIKDAATVNNGVKISIFSAEKAYTGTVVYGEAGLFLDANL